jgi:SAM-dependent methyltransferase
LEKKFEKKYHALEETNWWFRARRDMIRRIIAGYEPKTMFLEIGCSSGHLMKDAAQKGFFNFLGIDISSEAVKRSKENNAPFVLQMDGSRMGFKNNTFDVIIASAILEHIADDNQAMQEWQRVLKTGGDLIVFVPAFPSLWSDHDVVNRHFRRYRKRELVSLIQKNGFYIIKSSFWNFLLFSPVFVFRHYKKIFQKKSVPQGEFFNPGRFGNSLLSILLSLENVFLKYFSFPWGVSLFVIARKN